MTVLNENAISNHAGNNSATTFDFDFLINAEDELTVIRTADDGTQTTLTLNTDYSINETGNDNGSFITFPLDSSTYGLLQSDENISIFPNLAFTQETAYKNSSALNLENIENSFDYQCRLLQQLKVDTDRAIKLPHGSSMTADELLEEYQEAAAEIASSNSKPYFDTLPTGFYFQRGHKIDTSYSASAEGSMGYVCTTAGACYKEAWNGTHTYIVGVFVLGSDSKIYLAMADGGQAEDPVLDTDNTYWKLYADNAAVFKTYGAIAS